MHTFAQTHVHVCTHKDTVKQQSMCIADKRQIEKLPNVYAMPSYNLIMIANIVQGLRQGFPSNKPKGEHLKVHMQTGSETCGLANC